MSFFYSIVYAFFSMFYFFAGVAYFFNTPLYMCNDEKPVYQKFSPAGETIDPTKTTLADLFPYVGDDDIQFYSVNKEFLDFSDYSDDVIYEYYQNELLHDVFVRPNYISTDKLYISHYYNVFHNPFFGFLDALGDVPEEHWYYIYLCVVGAMDTPAPRLEHLPVTIIVADGYGYTVQQMETPPVLSNPDFRSISYVNDLSSPLFLIGRVRGYGTITLSSIDIWFVDDLLVRGLVSLPFIDWNTPFYAAILMTMAQIFIAIIVIRIVKSLLDLIPVIGS